MVRTDLVVQWRGQSPLGQGRCLSKMTITTKKVFFEPPRVPKTYAVVAAILAMPIPTSYSSFWFAPPQRNWFEFDLRSVTALHKWIPEFVSAPSIDQGDFSVSFALLRRLPVIPFAFRAPRSEVRAHFSALENTWSAAAAKTT